MNKKVLTLVAALIMLLLITGCSAKTKAPYISLTAAENGSEQLAPLIDENPLRIAIASIASTRESIIYYEALLEYLEEYMRRPIQIVQRKTHAEINDLLRAETVDLAFICSYSYILGKQEFGLNILVSPVINEEMEYYSYILVHKDSGIETFEELRGLRFAFTDPISTSGRLYPLYLLQQLGETPESYFYRSIFTYSHDNSVRAVAEQLVDGAAVDSLIFYYMEDRYPDVFADVVIIDQSEPFGIQPIVGRPGLDSELEDKLRIFFLTLHADERGKEILVNLKFDRFSPQEDSAYDSIREMADLLMR